MRRQDSCSDMRLDSAAASASVGHENLNAKTVGCMSGIICFLSKYHLTNSRKRKFLTFGKKQNQENKNGRVDNGSSCGSPVKMRSKSSSTPAQLTQGRQNGDKFYVGRVSCNTTIVPRSPTIPAEIRQTTPALIARLMGLEEMPDDHSSHKRQQLLGALEKCDQDLKALKKMIDVVRVRGPPKRSAIINNRFSDANFKLIKKPSPVSVIDASPSGNHPYYYYSDKQLSFNINYGGRAQQRKKPVAAEELDYYLSNPNPTSFINKGSRPPESSWHSNRMKNMMTESVGQVCRDIDWGEKREMGRIGLALQDHIYKTLIQELLAEMKSSDSYTSTSTSSGSRVTRVCSLSFEACKRRLSF